MPTAVEIPDEWCYIKPDLICGVRSIRYDPASRTGYAYLPPGHCVNMSTTVELFTRIDPKVTTICTISGDLQDTTYRQVDGEWQAYPPRAPGASLRQPMPSTEPVDTRPRPLLGRRPRRP